MKTRGSYHTLFALVILRMHHTHAGCSHYYTLLEIDELPMVSPKNFDNPTLLEYPQFNSTEEHRIIQNNLNCFIQLDCDTWGSFTDFKPALKISKTESTDIRIKDPHKTKDKLVIDESSRSDGVTTTEPSSSSGTDVTDEPMSKDETTPTILYQSTTVGAETTPTLYQGSTDDVEITPTPDQVTTDETDTTETPYQSTSTTDDIETTTETKDLAVAAEQSDEQKKNTLKTAIIVTSVLGGAALAAVLVAKGIALAQSGTYRFPDPTLAESRV